MHCIVYIWTSVLRYFLFIANTYTHSLTHSLTRLLTRSLTHSLTHSLAHSLIHSLIHSFTHSFTHLLSHSLIHSLTQKRGVHSCLLVLIDFDSKYSSLSSLFQPHFPHQDILRMKVYSARRSDGATIRPNCPSKTNFTSPFILKLQWNPPISVERFSANDILRFYYRQLDFALGYQRILE